MKKIISENFKRRCCKTWKIFESKFPLAFVFIIASCSVQNQMDKDDFQSIPKSFSGSFYDKLDTIPMQYDNRIFTRSLIKDFLNVENVNYAKPIRFTITKNEFFLTYEGSDTKLHVLKFYGKRYRKRFVFYTNYETITFPVLFMSKEMAKYSIYLPNEQELIFENHNENATMLLFLGGGGSSKKHYNFKLQHNE